MNKDSHTFVFVHAQNLQDLHSNKYDKHVRQAVMNNYLRKAMQDPSTTDRRITRQRRTDIRQRRKGATANYESPPDDHQSVGLENDVKLNTLTPKSDESLAFVPANESPILDQSPAHEAHTTTHSGSGTPASNDGASQRRCSSVFFKEVSDPGVEIERYFESFNHIKEQVIPTAIDVEWLRWNCVRYFRTQGMMQQWIPLQLLSPLAYLSRLCVTAPYTDIMTSQGFEDPAYPNSDPRLTLEIFDIVPRLINESMNDMAERCSDSCFVAVIQLFYGQLFSPYAGLVASHRQGLMQMIQQRGGIDCLGGDGILAMNVCLVNMEADVILNQPTDASHLQWSRSYITKHEAVREPCPEGPLHCVSPWMLSIASNSLCPLETFRAISLARQLSELVSGMYMSTASNSGPDSAYREIERERKQQDVSDLVLQIRQLPPAHTSSQSEPRVWIYESIRRAALLFAQAVSMRKPLHLACSDSLHRATVSAEDIYIAVKESPIVDVWGSMAGVLYWVLLIAAAAACNTQPERLDHRNKDDHEMTDVSDNQPRDAGTNPVHQVQNQTISAQAPRHTSDDLECDRRRLSITVLDTFQDSSLRWSAPLVSPPDMSQVPPEALAREQEILLASKRLLDNCMVQRCTEKRTVAGLPSPSKSAESYQTHTALGEMGERDAAAIDPEPLRYCNIDDGNKAPEQWIHGWSHEKTRALRLPHREYIRRYLTANAVRVSVLLRFDHPFVVVSSINCMQRCTAWLRGDR